MISRTRGIWKAVHVHVVERPVRIREHFAIRPENGPTFAFLPAGAGASIDAQAANARMIAAAPDLLEALKVLVADMEAEYRDGNGDVDHDGIEKARAAIAKAE